jgi:type I restriction enzyme S subunit
MESPPLRTRRFKPYPEYRDSGIEWLGEIPANWEVRRLKHLASLNPESLGEDADPGLEMVYVDIGGVDSLGRIVERESLTFGSAPSRARRLVRRGDVILSTVRTYLRAIAPINDPEPNLVVSTGFAVVRPADDLTTAYAAYALRAPYFVERVVANSKGVSFPAINESEMATYALAVPPVQEQRAIAAFLDRETAKIDALVAKKERLLELLEEKRIALITQAVTKGLEPNVPMKDSGVEWLGKIPSHWVVAPVYARYEVALGKMLDAKRVTGESPGRYLRNVDVQWDAVNTDGLPEMDFGPWERDRYLLLPGDVLVCEGGEVGRTAIWPGEIEECFYQKAIHRVRPRSEQEVPRFFYYVMYSMANRGVFVAGGNPNTIDHLTAVQLRHYRFPFAPYPEQGAIVAFLDSETARIDALRVKVRDAIDRLKELRTALISAAVTGKIDVREPRHSGASRNPGMEPA